MRRIGCSWLNNVAQGARCEAVNLDGIVIHMAETAINVLGMNYGGVDIIGDEQGDYSVIEVNSIPAWKGLQSVCDDNIADRLAEDFLNRCRAKTECEPVVSWG